MNQVLQIHAISSAHNNKNGNIERGSFLSKFLTKHTGIYSLYNCTAQLFQDILHDLHGDLSVA